MRVRISTKPTAECIDGVQLSRFQKGFDYEVSAELAELLIVEGWAEPIGFEPPRQAAAPARSHPSGRHERRSNIIRLR